MCFLPGMLTEPPAEAVLAAESLLDQLGAEGALAEQMNRYPLAPRLGRMLIEAVRRGVGEDGCRVAAMLSLGARSEKSDLLEALDLPPSLREAQQTEQLLRIARPPKQQQHQDDALLLSVLSGFPDRVGRQRPGNLVLLATGISAELTANTPGYEFLVALDAEDRRENALPLVRLTAKVQPEWLLDLFPARVQDRTTVLWNRTGDRVEQVDALLYDKLVIEESRGKASDREAASLLAEKALEAGVGQFVNQEMLDDFLARLAFTGLPVPDLSEAMRALCLGLHSFSELREAAKGFLPLLGQQVDSRLLEKLAPATITLPSGRRTRLHFEPGRAPWIASRLQDFFGMRESPRIGPDQTPVVVHLLAPNQRAVQTTTDLAGFWERLYPQVRKELMRRYPRHAWPERP